MNQKGQLQLEAIICFSVFLGMLALFLAEISNAEKEASQAMQALEAKAEAEACCIEVDTLLTSNALQLLSGKVNCTSEGNSVESKAGEKAKESKCLAKEIKTVQKGNESLLEVNPSGHYR